MSDSKEQPAPQEEPPRSKLTCPECGKDELKLLGRKFENEGQFQMGTLEAPQETKAVVAELQCLGCGHRFTHRQPRQ